MRTSLLYSAAAAALFFGAAAAAAPAPATPDALTQQLAPKLEPILGPKMVEKVMPSAHAGLYEVLTPRGIVYTDKTGSFVSFGPIVDTATKVNLTSSATPRCRGSCALPACRRSCSRTTPRGLAM